MLTDAKEPWRSAALWVSEETVIPFDRIAHWENPVKWNNFGGRITLAGDAAHPMAPRKLLPGCIGSSS